MRGARRRRCPPPAPPPRRPRPHRRARRQGRTRRGRRRPNVPARTDRFGTIGLATPRRSAACRATGRTDARSASSRRDISSASHVTGSAAPPRYRCQRGPRHTPAAASADNRGARTAPRCRRPAPLRRYSPERRRADIDDRGDVDAGRVQIERRAIGRVMRGGDHDAAARQHAVAIEIGARRIGQHDARPVVVRKHQRPLQRAGRDHHLPRAHLPQPLARQVRCRLRQVVGDALAEPHHVVREIAERGGTRQQGHPTICAERRQDRAPARSVPACHRPWRRFRQAASHRIPPVRRTG